MKPHIFLLFFLQTGHALAQTTQVYVHTTCNGKIVEIGDTLPGGIVLHTARYYLSDFYCSKQGNEVFREKNSYHLVDLENPESGHWSMNIPEYDAVNFLLGTDSLTNVSGAYGGDLDPTKGMYWTWNSGYINVKLEGTAPLVEDRNGAFGLHLGGYMPPFQTVQTVHSPVTASGNIHIEINVCPVLDGTDWRHYYNVMSPSAEAARLMKLLGQSIRIYAN